MTNTNQITRRRALALGASALASCSLFAQPTSGRSDLPKPGLEFCFEAKVQVDPARELGMIDGMQRRIIPITGGTVSGPRFNGRVVPGGADWQGIRPGDGLTRVFAHYWIESDDGVTVSIENTGIRKAEPAVMSRLMAGEIVPPDQYYFRTTPIFEVGDERYRWLNENVFVCLGARLPDAAVIQFFMVT